MEIKQNISTELRPEGARIMDAPLVSINLGEFIKTIKSETTWKNKDRNAITVYKTSGLRIVLIAMHEGTLLQKHSAEGILSLQVIDGQITFKAEGQTLNLLKGQMIALHEGLQHEIKAVKESVFLLTLATPRNK